MDVVLLCEVWVRWLFLVISVFSVEVVLWCLVWVLLMKVLMVLFGRFSFSILVMLL